MSEEIIYGRIAQLWCLPKHSNKQADPELAEDMTKLMREEIYLAVKAERLKSAELQTKLEISEKWVKNYKEKWYIACDSLKELQAKLKSGGIE